MPRYILGGTGAAAGIGLINSIGNLAGYFGPATLGWLKGPASGYTTGIDVMATSMAAAGLLALALGSRRSRGERAPRPFLLRIAWRRRQSPRVR